ncbi:MAG: DUF4407 domain-containing protein [Mycobacterium sp.]
MCARNAADLQSTGSRTATVLSWLGGGERRELDERHERSAQAIAGVVVILNAMLAWLVTTLAVTAAAHRPISTVAPFTLVFALMVAAISRAIASGPVRWPGGVAGRCAVALGVGVIVGEFAALAMFSGSIDRHLELQAAHNADSAPAVVQASASLTQSRNARVALDKAVDEARIQRDEALVVARCEYHPTPSCPQTRITGVPGSGPETRTAKQLFADAQRELDIAVTTREWRAPELDAQIGAGDQELRQERQTVIADADHGLGARWIAMQELTFAGAGALIVRLLAIAFFALLSLLPLILRLWRGETTGDRHAKAGAERERAELDAETAIAVKRAEVRAAAETLWAEQQLDKARLAVAAQTEIDRAQLRRRVNAALEGTAYAAEPVAGDLYLPIAAEAEAASLAATALPDTAVEAVVTQPENLPAAIEPADAPAIPVIPVIADVTRAASRWIRPLVPGFVARAIDTSTHPLRTARQVIEEVEEITFTLKRTRRVTVENEESAGTAATSRPAAVTPGHDGDGGDFRTGAAEAQTFSPRRLSTQPVDDPSLGSGRREPQRELAERDGPFDLRAADGPRQLPPAE